tara:strand:- start:20 stop:184 length:165 start_codon:yes stop_codon:yes gene_type:complete
MRKPIFIKGKQASTGQVINPQHINNNNNKELDNMKTRITSIEQTLNLILKKLDN